MTPSDASREPINLRLLGPVPATPSNQAAGVSELAGAVHGCPQRRARRRPLSVSIVGMDAPRSALNSDDGGQLAQAAQASGTRLDMWSSSSLGVLSVGKVEHRLALG